MANVHDNDFLITGLFMQPRTYPNLKLLAPRLSSRTHGTADEDVSFQSTVYLTVQIDFQSHRPFIN